MLQPPLALKRAKALQTFSFGAIGHLDGVKGVAIGQFTSFKPSKGITIVGLLHDHLSRLDVPILGGLPLGHGDHAATVPLGAAATLDTAAHALIVD